MALIRYYPLPAKRFKIRRDSTLEAMNEKINLISY